MTRISVLLAGAVLAACAPQQPNDVVQGVGFDDPTTLEARRARDTELTSSPIPEGPVIGDETAADITVPQNETEVVAEIAESETAPTPRPGNPGISDEQDFDAVSGRESIESDRERLERQREEFQVIQPEALPTRPGSSGPNIVAFALSTTNRVGEKIYNRTPINAATRFTRNCARYGSADLAQIDFLKSGGPERDRRGVDPDGDGFACFWDPAPYRAAGSN